MSFFERYSSCVTTEEGEKFVLKQVTDVDVLIANPTFNWHWGSISSNSTLLSDKRLFDSFGSKLNWGLLLEIQTDSTFLDSLENIDEMIGGDSRA